MPFLALFLMAAACQPRVIRPEELPTEVPANLDIAATAFVLTQNAPPPHFRDGIAVPEIDAKTDELSSWRSVVSLEFNGVFAGTSRQTKATTHAEIQFSLADSKRRVLLTVNGDLFDQDEPLITEGVRLGSDTFFVRDQVCNLTTDTEAGVIADLGAKDLIGGVIQAKPDGGKATINGQQVWRYAFNPEDLNLTNVHIGEGGRLLYSTGELWFAPEHNAVIRFYLTMDVENATIFGSQLPVTGTVIMQYDLYDIGIAQNINVPFGC
ncbi:MAG TPA: hypothetical protein VHL11_08660 [Phototrophicaceae bacterium]|nr:hypothetical protein [Phototrophicaceae bacterium]